MSVGLYCPTKNYYQYIGRGDQGPWDSELYEPRHEKTCLCHMRTTKVQIITFVVRYLDSIIPLLAKSNISRLWLISVAEQAGLSLTWSETTKTGFSHDVAHIGSN